MSDWEYELDEVGPDAEPDVDDSHRPIEPGSPTIENATFFVLGIALAIYLFLVLL